MHRSAALHLPPPPLRSRPYPTHRQPPHFHLRASPFIRRRPSLTTARDRACHPTCWRAGMARPSAPTLTLEVVPRAPRHLCSILRSTHMCQRGGRRATRTWSASLLPASPPPRPPATGVPRSTPPHLMLPSPLLRSGPAVMLVKCSRCSWCEPFNSLLGRAIASP